MKILFIINPSSGTSDNINWEEKISYLKKKYSFHYKVFFTTGENDSEKIKDNLKTFKPDTAVAAGGDGTINLVASLLIETDILLGIIPAGSANGLAYNLNIPTDIEEAFERISQNSPISIDAIVLNNKHFCFHLCDTGLNARIVKRFEKEGAKGIAGYAKQLIKELFSKRTAFITQLETEDFIKKIKAEMIIVANAKSFGTGAQINPDGEYDDGKFEIIVIKPYPWWFVFRLAVSSFTGNLSRLENVDIISLDKIKLSFMKPQDLQIDGEIFEGISSLKIDIIPGALKVL